MGEIEIRLVQNLAEREAMYYQRWLVLRVPLGMARGTETDQFDQCAVHVVAVSDQTIIGSARLRQLPEEMGSIAYVAVLPEFQGQGIGTLLVQKLIEVAQKKQLKRLRVMARIGAIAFYQRLGFLSSGETKEYLGIQHTFMVLNLPSSSNREAAFL